MPQETRKHRVTLYLNSPELAALRHLAALDVDSESEQEYLRRLLRSTAAATLQPLPNTAPAFAKPPPAALPQPLTVPAPVLSQSSPAPAPKEMWATPELKKAFEEREAAWLAQRQAEAAAKREL